MSNNIDGNVWYVLSYAGTLVANQAVDINSSGSGAIIGRPLNSTLNQNTFQWQILPIGPSNTYVLRPRYLGNQYFMGVFTQPLPSLPGMDTRIASFYFKSPDAVPNTAQWIIEATPDGTGMFYLSTVANGTNIHLDCMQGINYLKDASTGYSSGAMKWALKSQSEINDQNWSYTATATKASATSSSTSTLPASNSASVTSTSNTVQQSQSSSNSTTPIGVIVGGVIGGLALLLIVVVAIVFYRLWKRKNAPQYHQYAYTDSPYPDNRKEVEGKELYGSQHGVVAQSPAGVYEKDQILHGGGYPTYRSDNTFELPAESASSQPGTFKSSIPTHSISTRS